ncbi:dirigent protein 22-like [Phalaenopsis equestris]|uniref:dirigent protein 22-like n=1 Tax=Phalaenopsis equestris TaxID=78828 RepID=UPI0009E47EE8|nr:dirigent protein 22-like [Phalaenopsis equestris]
MSLATAIFLLFLLLCVHPHPTVSADEEETHIHFYFHDVVSGFTPTAIRVAQAPTTTFSTTGFGAVVMIDDPLTEGPDRSSKLLGHAQGMYALASQEEAGLLMAMNLAFVDGDFNGSTLTVLGRNTVFSDVREMPVVGGSGKFRYARGYALARTHKFDLLTGDAIVEYDVYVRHE